MNSEFLHQPCLWVVGYPRSGNTWINYLCSYCLNLPYCDFDALDRPPQKEWVREAVAGKNAWQAPPGFAAVVKTHRLPPQVPHRNGGVIYLQRDPRDVFVSQHHFLQHQARRGPKRFWYQLLGIKGKNAQMRWFVQQWQRHVLAWKPFVRSVIQYEKIRREGAPYFVHSLQKAGFEVSHERARQAMEFFAFDKMSEGRKAGEGDAKSFFRRGVVGDHRNHLSEAEHQLFAPALMIAEML